MDISHMPGKSVPHMRVFTQVREKHLQLLVYKSILGTSMNTKCLKARLVLPPVNADSCRKG